MQKNILITGMPKSGKSTLLRALIKDIPNRVGLVVNEIIEENSRVGFEIETSAGHKVLLAHVNFDSPHKVSKYFVNIENLETLIPEVSNFQPDNFLYLDEIGQMQMLSDKFKDFALKYLDSPNICLVTVSKIFEDDFIRAIKQRDDIILVEILPENRVEKELFLTQLIRKVKKAKKYVSEPQRFIRHGSIVELKSEHDTRTLSFVNDAWNCSCDFFAQYSICSHTLAVREIFT